jgi:hypothetical protein
MDPKSILIYVHRNGWTEQLRRFHSTIGYHLTSPHLNESNEAILRALGELPFSSIRQLPRAAHLPATTVYRQLYKKLGFTAGHL